MSTRADLLAALSARIVSEMGEGLMSVAIDGVDGAGKTVFGDALAEALRARGVRVIRSGIDGFHNSRAVRYRRGADSPEGFYRDSFNLTLLRETLLYPLRIGRPAQLAAFDHRQNRRVRRKPVTPVLPAVLVFDGVFLHRDELRDEWDLTVFLDVPFEEAYRRMGLRDGCNPDPEATANRRYLEGQRLYLREARPRESADIVIDNGDPASPVVVRGLRV